MSEPESLPAGGQPQGQAPEQEKSAEAQPADQKPAEAQSAKPKPRRLTDEERKALWHRAVVEKARKLKLFSDAMIFLFLVLVLVAHVFTFTGELKVSSDWQPKRGYEIVLDLLTRGTRPYIYYKVAPDGTPVVDRATGRRLADVQPAGQAGVLEFAYLAVPFGAALFIVLYLLDYLLWMGRLLPVLSGLYGFGSVGYLVATRLPENGTWNALRLGSLLAWYLLLIPLFLLGVASLLRYFVSHRRKRYEFAGLPVPGRSEASSQPSQPSQPSGQGGEKNSGQ